MSAAEDDRNFDYLREYDQKYKTSWLVKDYSAKFG